jgi:hypothetical protein
MGLLRAASKVWCLIVVIGLAAVCAAFASALFVNSTESSGWTGSPAVDRSIEICVALVSLLGATGLVGHVIADINRVGRSHLLIAGLCLFPSVWGVLITMVVSNGRESDPVRWVASHTALTGDQFLHLDVLYHGVGFIISAPSSGFAASRD